MGGRLWAGGYGGGWGTGHTEGCVHTRQFVATARVLLFKGGAGAGPGVERSELKGYERVWGGIRGVTGWGTRGGGGTGGGAGG